MYSNFNKMENINEQKQPTKEEMFKWMEDQISFKKVQLELQKLDTEIAKQRAEYMKAMYTIAQISNPQKEESSKNMKHVLTEEDLKANPDLAEQGLKVGDEVEIPNHDVIS